MARQNTNFQNFTTVAGAALIGLGAFILFTKLTEAASQASHLLGMTADGVDTLGPLAAGALAASNASQAYLFDRTEFLRGVSLILLSFWPLLLVVVGALFLRACSTGRAEMNSKKKNADMSISLLVVRRIDRAEISADREQQEALLLI